MALKDGYGRSNPWVVCMGGKRGVPARFDFVSESAVCGLRSAGHGRRLMVCTAVCTPGPAGRGALSSGVIHWEWRSPLPKGPVTPCQATNGQGRRTVRELRGWRGHLGGSGCYFPCYPPTVDHYIPSSPTRRGGFLLSPASPSSSLSHARMEEHSSVVCLNPSAVAIPIVITFTGCSLCPPGRVGAWGASWEGIDPTCPCPLSLACLCHPCLMAHCRPLVALVSESECAQVGGPYLEARRAHLDLA